MSGLISGCCEKLESFSEEICKNLFPYGAGSTAGSSVVSGACGASAALVGVTAVPGVLYGATAGAVFYVTMTAMNQFTDNTAIQAVVSAALAVIAGIYVTSAVLAVKISVAAALLMSAASATTILAVIILAENVGKCLKDELPAPPASPPGSPRNPAADASTVEV